MITTLQKLKEGERAVVRDIHGGHGIRSRLQNLGLHPGDTVEVIRSGFMGGPVLIEIHGFEVAIGQGQAQQIEVEKAEP
jgi:ferrous iron transport protein A